VARLRAYHAKHQNGDGEDKLKGYGLDLVAGKVRDNIEAGVLEPVLIKMKSIQFATEAAIRHIRIPADSCCQFLKSSLLFILISSLSILRIDDAIEMEKPQQQQGGYGSHAM